MRFVFLNYSYTPGYNTPGAWIQRIKPYLLQLEVLGQRHFTAYVGQIDYTGTCETNGVHYHFSQPRSKRSLFPRQLHTTVKRLQPDIVIVAGFIFPLQVIQLRRTLGKKVKIFARHHADKPGGWKRKWLQRIADHSIDAYLFTAIGNATEWIEAGIVSPEKIYELPEAATSFSKQDKQDSRRITGMTTSLSFLWVGRLNANKDPLTVLAAFGQYAAHRPDTRLYMIYQEEDMLQAVQQVIADNEALQGAVVLVGKIPHEQLPAWYSAADYFILASHNEGGSYALNEAMACGCIPIVSNIPASMKTIGNGQAGHYFDAGDVKGLLQVLNSLEKEDEDKFSQVVQEYSGEHLSAEAIAAGLESLCFRLV